MSDDKEQISVTANERALSQALKYVVGADQAAILPSIVNPKLVLPLCGLRLRWRLSKFYPAFSIRAKPWRMLQRFRALFGLVSKLSDQNNEKLHQFIYEIFPDITHTSVLLGTPGPTRKIIVQLWAGKQMVGYLKVATTVAAAEKIQTETNVLEKLPEGCGPKLLKYSDLDGNKAMLLSLVEGEMLNASLLAITPEDGGIMVELNTYLERLNVRDDTFAIGDHPAIVRLREGVAGDRGAGKGEISHQSSVIRLQGFEEIIFPLRKRTWPLVIQHGDFAPWNVFRLPDGSLCSIDWEEGCVEGFPFFDLIHFIGQTAFLCQKWSQKRTLDYLYETLRPMLGSSASSIIKLGLLSSYVSLQQTVGDDHPIQKWRKDMWEID
ncbi:MAG: phosphotransferase [Pontiella sp.]